MKNFALSFAIFSTLIIGSAAFAQDLREPKESIIGNCPINKAAFDRCRDFCGYDAILSLSCVPAPAVVCDYEPLPGDAYPVDTKRLCPSQAPDELRCKCSIERNSHE